MRGVTVAEERVGMDRTSCAGFMMGSMKVEPGTLMKLPPPLDPHLLTNYHHHSWDTPELGRCAPG